MTLLLTNKLDHVPTPKMKGVFFKEKKRRTMLTLVSLLLF